VLGLMWSNSRAKETFPLVSVQTFKVNLCKTTLSGATGSGVIEDVGNLTNGGETSRQKKKKQGDSYRGQAGKGGNGGAKVALECMCQRGTECWLNTGTRQPHFGVEDRGHILSGGAHPRGSSGKDKGLSGGGGPKDSGMACLGTLTAQRIVL